MSNLFNAGQIARIKQFFRDSLETVGDSFRLYYTPKWVACTNCMDLVNETYANNIGMHGGPMVTICPQCNGTHKIEQEVTEDIILSSNLNQNDINKTLGPNVELPGGGMWVRGSIGDWPKLQRAVEIRIINNGTTEDRYRLKRQAIDGYATITEDYFTALLERIS